MKKYFIPKRGDFYVYGHMIAIANGEFDRNGIGRFVSYSTDSDMFYTEGTRRCGWICPELRRATKAKKAILLEQMDKNGLYWDEETKELIHR